MGTSTSFRAPSVPRWQAFATALQRGLPLDRVRSELFNAGQEWEQALAAPAVAAFAVALTTAYEELPQRLRSGERPEQALLQLAAEARAASDLEAGTPALALAERAFTALLTRTTAGETSLSQTASEAAAERFAAARGQPGELVAAYVGELLGQYARHVTAREAGRLTEGPDGLGVGATRRLTRQLAAVAREVAADLPAPPTDAAAVRERWPVLVRTAFARGRRLPGERR
jgi:hypothetical protein